jgi:phosphoribosylformylglycinamidine cyclo-ligase
VSAPPSGQSAYARAGVDIDAQERALERVKQLAQGTFTPGVIGGLGGFGGVFRPNTKGLSDPLLVASADGVGTKLAVAKAARDFSTVGHDLVNHCVNDILAQGARPLFFLDYVGAGTLDPDQMVALVGGVAAGCRENGCALIGGETAEMPGFYQPGDYELVGFIVGLVDAASALGPQRVQPGDVLIGLPSSGLHTNGYSLARRILFEVMGLGIDDVLDLPGKPRVAEALLAVHRSYLRAFAPLLGDPALHALAHITGGGITDNLPRILPAGCGAEIRRDAWKIPPLFRLLQTHGEVDDGEMLRVFNMGVGVIAALAREQSSRVLEMLRAEGEAPFVIGAVREGGQGVVYHPADDGA